MFSAALLVLLALPMLVIAAAVKLDSTGGVLYRQERLGRAGRPFIMLKFRTMEVDAEQDGPMLAVMWDPRCTRTGIFLRRFHLDELPQLWNILCGDMSFVGPRPERAFFYREYEKSVEGFDLRLLVKPGLTGLAQIKGGDLSPPEKLFYDMEYIRTRSAGTDVSCLIRTFPAVLAKRREK